MQQIEAPTGFLSEHWGDIASVAGVIISLVGFLITIIGVMRSKKAAQRAEEAVREVKKTILRADTMVELSTAVAIMEEIKRLHRITTAWEVLLDRYSILKRLLVTIRSSYTHLSEDHKTSLQNAIQHLSGIERKVERALALKSPPPNVAAINDVISSQIDNVSEVLAVIRREME